MENANLLGRIDDHTDPDHAGLLVLAHLTIDFRPAVERRPNLEDDLWGRLHVLSEGERPLGDTGVAVVRYIRTPNGVRPPLGYYARVVRDDASDLAALQIGLE